MTTPRELLISAVEIAIAKEAPSALHCKAIAKVSIEGHIKVYLNTLRNPLFDETVDYLTHLSYTGHKRLHNEIKRRAARGWENVHPTTLPRMDYTGRSVTR